MKTSSIISTSIILLILAFFLYFLFQIISLPGKISLNNDTPSALEGAKDITRALTQSDSTPLRGEKEGRINILLLGRAGTSHSGKDLTDTIALLSIDTVNYQAGLLSIPRDLYAPIGGTNSFTKINSIYQYGLREDGDSEAIEKTASFITGVPIHYTIIVDFDGFEKIVDAIGGVTIHNARDIRDTLYPGKNYSYETFELKAGWHTLDGKTALKYVRERHDDPEGDFGRAKRQQEVLQALHDKALDPTLFGNIFTIERLLTALGESVRTDIATREIESFLSLGKKVDSQNISTTVVDAWKKESLLRVDHIDTPSGAAFVLVPRSGTWEEVRDLAGNLLHLSAKQDREERIRTENARILIASNQNRAKNARVLQTFLEESLHIASVRTTILPKNQVEEKSFIAEKENLATPYALDALLKALPIEKRGGGDVSLTTDTPYDILIVIGRDFKGDILAAPVEDTASRHTIDDFETVLEPLPYSGIKN
ncbi:MAG: LCP family protein [Candidatus Moraniibacteriota bacterium]